MSQRTNSTPTNGLSLTRVISALAVTAALSTVPLLAAGTASASSASAPALPAGPATKGPPVYAHMESPTPAEIAKRIDAGWATGAFLYYNTKTTFGWSSQWDDLEAAFPAGIDLFVSPKKFTAESLTNWAQKLSPAQRAKTIFAYWQEPEDNHTTDAARADFRAKVALAADILQPLGIRNGIEMQAWTLNANNNQAWGGKANFKAFLPDDRSDLDYVGISLYDYHQNFSGKTQLKPVKNLLNNQVPDAGWGPVASGWSVPTGTSSGDAIRAERAAAAADGFAYARSVGADAYGWFDFPGWDGTKDYGVTGDAALLGILTDL